MTDAEDLLLEIANSMEKDFLDPAEHANWCIEAAKAYFVKRGAAAGGAGVSSPPAANEG